MVDTVPDESLIRNSNTVVGDSGQAIPIIKGADPVQVFDPILYCL